MSAPLLWGLLAAGAGSAVSTNAEKPDRTVSFAGLLARERRPEVPDAEKVAGWQTFLKELEAQRRYAQDAVARWQDAPRLRAVAATRSVEEDAQGTAREKAAAWASLLERFDHGPHVARARARLQHWRTVEGERLAAEALRLEALGASAVDRIRAWRAVEAWGFGPLRQGRRRLARLRTRLLVEARTLDAMQAVGPKSKRRLWRRVLAGHPAARAEAKRALARLDGDGAG